MTIEPPCEGQWNVDVDEDATYVIIEFAHMGESGVETFTTSMLPRDATVFAAGVLNNALECDGDG